MLDRAALTAALNDVAERHEVLRTVFPEGGGQHITAPDITLQDGGSIQEAATTPFDLTRETPFRAHLIDHTTLVLVLHHIACDGWSLAPLARDLATAYTARTHNHPPRWTPLPVQYADYTLWQHELLGDENNPDSRAAQQLTYWTTQLAGLPEEITLPTDRRR
ncbi:condensation domain-containing protein, partial [Streptomyces sp. ACA25]|uniref:condensation domain-containing protein n=1 Tax=Streptomyces sp. ACA25 TaxID=3022596 RepID=UPI002307718D